LTKRSEVARGDPEVPLSDQEIKDKFHQLVAAVADRARLDSLARAASGIKEAKNVQELADLLAYPASAQDWEQGQAKYDLLETDPGNAG
jgi:hypothetical protein